MVRFRCLSAQPNPNPLFGSGTNSSPRARRSRPSGHAPSADPEELAERQMKRKVTDIQRELDEFRVAKQAAASGAAATSMYGDKKGGASQDGVKTDKGKIFTVSWDGRVDSHRSSLSLREFAPPERGYVASFCGRPIGVDSAVQKQATRRVEF